MDIINFDSIRGLRFHRNIPWDFPNLFVDQSYEGNLVSTLGGSYLDYSLTAIWTIRINVRDNVSTDITTANNQAIFNLHTFPNPANGILNISYILPARADVSFADYWLAILLEVFFAKQKLEQFNNHLVKEIK